jgi:predicted RNase H-like nuclease (RuvC/YqgF family)
MHWGEIVVAIISGGTLQYVISTKLMPKREKREADAIFIDTLMKRIDVLESRVDTQTLLIKELIGENERLKVEIKYLKEK